MTTWSLGEVTLWRHGDLQAWGDDALEQKKNGRTSPESRNQTGRMEERGRTSGEGKEEAGGR